MSLPLKHIAIIMDGNRRWASSKKLPQVFGHKEGVKSLKRIVKHAAKEKLEYLTVYAFSSENWQRSQEEVDYLFKLFATVIQEELSELSSANVRLNFIGQLNSMPKDLQKDFTKASQLTSKNTGLSLQVALNYGSRLEILEALKDICSKTKQEKIKIEDLSEELINSHLYTKNLPDPDLIIRTGGEMRLSNFLLWQAAYAELYVTETMWPDFDIAEFDQAIKEFTKRKRRYGGD